MEKLFFGSSKNQRSTGRTEGERAKGMGVSVQLTNNHDWVQYLYGRYKDSEVIRLTVEKDGIHVDYEMSVADAEKLAQDLIDWTREVKPYSEMHDADEEVSPQAIDPTESPSAAAAEGEV